MPDNDINANITTEQAVGAPKDGKIDVNLNSNLQASITIQEAEKMKRRIGWQERD